MKNLSVFLAVLLGLALHGNSQIHEPVEWSFGSKHLSGNQYELQFTATIDEGWHVYSQHIEGVGPVPTSFTFDDNSDIKLIGEVSEPRGHKEYDPNFEMDLIWFDTRVTFTQKVELLSDETTVKGELTYMVCNDEMCLPPEYPLFSIPLKKGNTSESSGKKEDATTENTTSPEVHESTKDAVSRSESNSSLKSTSSGIKEPVKWSFEKKELDNGNLKLSAKATIDDGWHIYSINLPDGDGPVATEFNILSGGIPVGKPVVKGTEHTEYDKNFMMELSYYETKVTIEQEVKPADTSVIAAEVYFMTCDDEMCLPPEAISHEFTISKGPTSKVNKKETRGMWGILLVSFLGGFAALLTPCVFPMIPLTVSFFTKQSGSRSKGMAQASLYGLFIIGIYVILSIPFHLIDSLDPSILNQVSTNVPLNILFFVIFIVFAISFFGAFEITIPSSIINKADSASNVGGIVGTFFMSLTLALVSFSCTGPILGALLGSTLTSDGGATALSIGMFGFGLGLALPFALFAMFPSWLNNLPQSGGWLNSVKVFLGFLELALALKFLSNADLVLQTGLLTREIFLAIWIGIFALMTLYLLGFMRLPHDSPIERLSVPRMLLALVSLIFTLYLVPGLWGAPLKLISGFPPPTFYSESPGGFSSGNVISTSSNSGDHSSTATHESCPHGLPCFHDYEEALVHAKKVKKPLMIDFTGWACVNCRRMEDKVWSDPAVLRRLANDVVLVSLYVDERTKLPEDEQKVVKVGRREKKLKTIGDKWAYLQTSRYNNNSQPYYVMLDLQENQLHEATGYDPDIDKFIDWLDRGKAAFEKTLP